MKLYYRTPMAPEDAAARLREHIGPVTLRYSIAPGSTYGKPFVGSVEGRHFNFRIRQEGRNSFAPSAVGEIRRTGAGSEVIAEVGIGFAVSHAAALLVVLCLLFVSPVALTSAELRVPFLLIAAAAVAVAALLWTKGPESSGWPPDQAKQLKEFLDSTFTADRS